MRLILALLIAALGFAGSCAAQIDPTRAISQGVTAAKPAYGLGEAVCLSYAVRNDSRAPVTFDFPTAKQFDLWVVRGDEEVFRLSAGMRYAQSASTLSLQPGEARTFSVGWDQRDKRGKQVGPGVYTVYAQLTTSGKAPPATMGKVRIGVGSAAVVPITVSQAVGNTAQVLGRKVTIVGTYRGFSPYPNDPNTKTGPPVSRSDWAICDATGCMYVHGSVILDPTKDIGTAITVVGKIATTDNGQVYMNLESATTSKGSVCPPGGG